jgi:hypothetical protein
MSQDDPLEGLVRLHAEVDAQAKTLAARLGDRLQCGRGCADCCVDELTVFEVEAERIRRAHPTLLREGAPRAPGACAFLDAEGACRVYAERPYVCRTQGLPLRWLDELDGSTVERRDVCPLNDRGEPPLERLPAADCWTLGPAEARLRELQTQLNGELRRVPLRGLFVSEAE